MFRALRVGLGFPVLQAVLLSAGLLEFLAAAVLLPAGLPADRVVLRAEALLSAVLLVLPAGGLFRRRL